MRAFGKHHTDFEILCSAEAPIDPPAESEEAPEPAPPSEEAEVAEAPTEVQEPIIEEKVEDNPAAEPQEEVQNEEPPAEIASEPEKVEEQIVESEPVLDDAPKGVEEQPAEPEAAAEDAPKDVEEPEHSPADDSPKDVEAPEEPKDVDKSSIPVAEIAVGAAAIGVIGMIAANMDAGKEEPITDKGLVDEPQTLEDVAEEPAKIDAPPSPKSDKRSSKHRSSRHSTHSSRHSSSKEKDSPSEDSHRPHSHRRRRDSDNSLMAMFTPTSPKKQPSRHDSGYSQGSGGSSHRRHRTPEEQAAHDKRKAERAAKAKPTESESAVVDGPAGVPVVVPNVPRRLSSRRHSHSYGSKSDDKRPQILKGESVVKSPFMARKDEPHIKEEVKEVKKPIIERPRFSIDGERPPSAVRKEKGRSHSHRDRGSRHSRERSSKESQEREERHRKQREERQKKERDEIEKYRVEKEREARKVRREAEKQMLVAREEVAEEGRRQREKEDEERRIRREERRRRREAEDKAAEEGSGSVKGKEPERERERIRKPRSDGSKDSNRHRERRREREIPKEDKSPLKSLWSSAKKVFG